MKKLILSILLIVVSVISFAQPKIVRTTAANTIYDTRHGALLNEILPTFADTVEASLPNNIGLDSCGAIFFSRSDGNVYLRRCSPLKYWAAIGSGSGSGFITANNGLTASTTTNVQWGGDLVQNSSVNGKNLYNVTFDSTSNFDVRLKNSGTFKIRQASSLTSGVTFDQSQNGGMFVLDAQNLNEVGFKYIGQDWGYMRNEIINTITPTIAAANGQNYAGSVAALKWNFTYGGQIGSIGVCVKNSPYADSAFSIYTGGTRGMLLQADNLGFIRFTGSGLESGTEYGRFAASTGFLGLNTTLPTHQLTVNGQIRVNSINNASVFDSVVVINNGVFEARLASDIIASTPTWQQTLTAGSTLSGNNTATLGTTSFTWSSANVTGSTTSSAIVETYNSLTNGTGHYISSSSQIGGSLVTMAMTGTAGGGKQGLVITSSGANASSNIVTYGAFSNITNSGTGSSNVGYYSNVSSAESSYGFYADGGSGVASLGVADQKIGYFANITGGTVNVGGRFSASGGTSNYAIIVPSTGGKIGFGLTSPTAGILHITNPVTTGTTTTSGIVIDANSLTSGVSEYHSSTSITSGTLLSLISTSTVLAAGNEMLNIAVSGANGTNAITATGGRISVTNTNGTSGTNVALELTASGATTANIALQTTAGQVILGAPTTDANQALNIQSLTNTASEGIRINANNNTANLKIGYQTILTSGGMVIQASSTGVELVGPSGTGASVASSNTAPTSTFSVFGSFSTAYRAISALRTLDATDYTIDCTANTFQVTLPTAAGITGRIYIIKNSGAGTITIGTTSSQTIDGAASKTLNVQYTGFQLQSDGANWKIIASF